MRYLSAIIGVACLLNIPANSLASGLFTEIGLEARYVRGDSSYYINGVDPALGSWASELEFPLDNFMAGVNLAAETRHYRSPLQPKSRLCLSLLVTVTNDAGIMKDSDWIENDAAYGEPPHAGKDIYTESDAQAQGIIFDISYAYHFRSNRLTLGPMIGHRYQEFEYDIYGYRGVDYETPVYGEGKVLDYEVTYRLPYIGLSSNLLFGRNNQLQLHFRLAYSNWASAEDRDDHILRYKLSEGDCEGDAYLADFTVEWRFRPRWILGLGTEYVDIDTRGGQHQEYYAGPSVGTTYDINDRITSSYWSAMLRVSYSL